MANPGPARLPLPKPAKLPKFSGEDEDLKSNKLQRWLKTMRKTLSKSGITDDTPDVADLYGMYIEGAAQSPFQTLDDEFDKLTLDQLNAHFKQLFERSTNTNDTYHEWQNIRQTSGSQPVCITKIVRELADLRGSLPRGSISDYTQRQRFLDAMDTRLCQNVEPQLRPEDT